MVKGRTNITIDPELLEYARRERINISRLIEDSLIEQMHKPKINEQWTWEKNCRDDLNPTCIKCNEPTCILFRGDNPYQEYKGWCIFCYKEEFRRLEELKKGNKNEDE